MKTIILEGSNLGVLLDGDYFLEPNMGSNYILYGGL